MRLAFLGTPEFALPAFEALLDAGHEVVRAYAQPPRPADRGHRLRPSPVQAFAEARGIPAATPTQAFAILRSSGISRRSGSTPPSPPPTGCCCRRQYWPRRASAV